ncbi:MAG TPA: hypothetical protein DEB06_00970, partial [Phycisphaerales bacterium]|nr:hypothetical protein [Phycisphaerales bacterium]
VTGAHLRAEIGDRPIAYAMRDTILDRLSRRPEDERLGVLVCSDIWYLNNDELRACPTISIGGPGVNALAAFLVERLPSAFTVKDVLTVQMDTDFVDLIASCWGHGTAPTRSAAEAFIARYLDLFLEKAVLRAV